MRLHSNPKKSHNIFIDKIQLTFLVYLFGSKKMIFNREMYYKSRYKLMPCPSLWALGTGFMRAHNISVHCTNMYEKRLNISSGIPVVSYHSY